jgi:hypothetical protein
VPLFLSKHLYPISLFLFWMKYFIITFLDSLATVLFLHLFLIFPTYLPSKTLYVHCVGVLYFYLIPSIGSPPYLQIIRGFEQKQSITKSHTSLHWVGVDIWILRVSQGLVFGGLERQWSMSCPWWVSCGSRSTWGVFSLLKNFYRKRSIKKFLLVFAFQHRACCLADRKKKKKNPWLSCRHITQLTWCHEVLSQPLLAILGVRADDGRHWLQLYHIFKMRTNFIKCV